MCQTQVFSSAKPNFLLELIDFFELSNFDFFLNFINIIVLKLSMLLYVRFNKCLN